MQFIIHPHDPENSIASLGGKAAALKALTDENLPIPDWFVVKPIAFHPSNSNQLQQSFLGFEWGAGAKSLRGGEASTPPVHNLLVTPVMNHLKLDDSVRVELNEALAKLCPNGELVAVRSSAVDEDGRTHSFAGQLESFLFVKPEDVEKRILDVWRSGFSDRILAYRQENQLAGLPEPPAVLIQKMVNPEVAGVAFSANPVTGQRGIAVISAVYGLGTSLVSGEADADTYQVDRHNQIIQKQIVEKRSAHQFSTSDVVTVPVSDEFAHRSALTDAQVQSIATLVRQVERFFHRPQDIEWAIENDRLYLLQARPITTIAQMPDPDGVLNLWDNSNIVESYGGITTPLTFSFARRAYEEVYRQFCRMMGVSEGAIAQHDKTFRRMIGFIQGRVYYNLLNWYRVLALLPGFTVNRRFMEQMMGVREELPPDVLATLSNANFRDKVRDSLNFGRSIAGLVTNYLTLPKQINRFYARLDRALSLPPSALETLRPDELAAYYHDLERQLLTRWDAPLINDFFAMIFYGVLRKLTAKWCNDENGTLQNDLISGEGNIISAEPAHRMQQMAATIAPYPNFVQLLCNASLSEILREIPNFPDFQTQYEAYLTKFGDRCLEELKLESPTLQDEPLMLLRAIGSLGIRERGSGSPSERFASGDQGSGIRDRGSGIGDQGSGIRDWGLGIGEEGSGDQELSGGIVEARLIATKRVNQFLNNNPLRKIIFNWVLKNARNRVRDRENLRFERTRLFGRVRRIFLEMGKRFYAIDLLNAPRDIFYLELAEILGFIDGTTTTTDLKGLVALRKAEFDRYQTLPYPGDRFSTVGSVHPHRAVAQKEKIAPSEASLQGTGCCPGIVRAPVQVITDPKNAHLKQGSILVAERTDPGWIMLFPAASGILVERGSLLSHSAIVAREMGIPAIVSIPGITQWLKDGDWVEMDGSSGIVRRMAIDVATDLKPDETDGATQPQSEVQSL